MSRSSTSPFRGVQGGVRGGSTPESLELLIKSLQRENNGLVQEVNVLKQKGRKITELEVQVDLVLKHNNQLLAENERMAKLVNQKKNQVEVWKNKYETLTVNRSASSQLESRKLINEIEKLKEEITDIQHMKNMQLSELKNQNHLQIQNIKRHHLGNNQKYELEIRKLKEYCEKKEYQISDLNMKLVRLSKETDFEIGKLREEKERLRGDLLYEEQEHRKQVDSLKSKFEYNFHSEIQNLKKQHLNQVEALDYENSKLKEVINSKNSQIEQILAKNLKVKNNYEDSLDLLKKQNEDLKDKIFETERIADIELSNLRDKLEGIKQSELSLLKNAHSNQQELLNREIRKLQEIIQNQNNELETLAKEKTQVRQSLESEIVRAKAELEAQIHENRQLANQHEKQLILNDIDLKGKNQEMRTTEAYLHSQVNTLKSENLKLAQVLDRKTKALEKQREQSYADKRSLENELQSHKDRLNLLREDLERETRRGSSESEDLKQIHELKVKQLETKIRGLEQEAAERESLIAQLKQTIQARQKEIKLGQEKIVLLEKTEKEIRREAKESLSRWQAKEEEYNGLVKSQTEAQERARRREIEELKSIQDNKISSLKHQIRELERHIEDKNRILNDLKEKYEGLVNKFEEIFAQRAAQKNLDIKIPGWIPDTLAIKSLFDVFLKNKVLEYCS